MPRKQRIFWTGETVCDIVLTMFASIDNILPGISLHLHPTDKFKTVVIKLFVKQPLRTTLEATANALLLRVLARGSRKYASMRKMNIFLESLYGAAFGSDISKIGEYAIMEYYLELINPDYMTSAGTRLIALAKAFNFLREMVMSPIVVKKGLRPDYCRQEQKNLRDIIESLFDDKMAFAEERCTAEMCKNEPYGIFEYGRIEDIERVTPAKLFEHHQNVLRTAPMEFFVSGQFKPGKIEKVISETFHRFKYLHKDMAQMKTEPVRAAVPESPRVITEKQPIDQGKLVMGLRTNTTWADDDVFSLMMANGILGGFPHSKLFRNVREKAGLAYAVSSVIERTKGLMMIKAGINHDKFEQAVGIIKEQIDTLQQGNISEIELNDTRKSIVTRLKSLEDNASALINFQLELILNKRPGLTPAEIIQRIETVTQDSIVNAARKLELDTIYFLTSN